MTLAIDKAHSETTCYLDSQARTDNLHLPDNWGPAQERLHGRKIRPNLPQTTVAPTLTCKERNDFESIRSRMLE